MTQTILIAGTGFAGLWSALSAARAAHLAGKHNEIDIAVVSPAPTVVIRPRLYEAVLENMAPDISDLLQAVGVRHIAGLVESFDIATHTATIMKTDGTQTIIPYARLILATGSRLHTPDVPGLTEHGFNVDTLEAAQKLNFHLLALKNRPESAARNTVVVAGGGLTGIESAAEMPDRLRAILGKNANIRVMIVDPAKQIGADIGVEAAPVIRRALTELGVEQKPQVRISAVDADTVTLSDGEVIPSATLIWSAGMRAHPLAAHVPGEKDVLGRVVADAYLRAPEAPGIFVTGDMVKAATDNLGNFTVMSCQHALMLGRVAGHNAAAELVGLPLHPYSQPNYATCLDLGAWGALVTDGWDRKVRLTGVDAKRLKKEINNVWIYPPAPNRDAVFSLANPDYRIAA